MARQLLEAILDHGVANPHYFDGRLLTATALREDQQAHRTRQRHLGRALGPGVVGGLWVGLEFAGSGTAPPRVTVSAGLAIDGHGNTLELPASEVIALARTLTPPRAGADLFRTCEPPTQQVEGLGEGFYIFVMAPASGFRGRAPVSGLSDPTAGAGCGSQWAMEGVRFRLVPLDPLAVPGLSTDTRQLLETQLLTATDPAGRSRLRNVVANLCLGTEPLATFAIDPFAREVMNDVGATEAALADYGALDGLRDSGVLTDCDVPLALVCWRGNGVEFLDNWSVRRRLASPMTADRWPVLSSGRRRAEAKATLFQFQEQLASVIEASPNPVAIRAVDFFRWLPPAGVLPVPGGAPGKAVDHTVFFDTIVFRDPVFLEGARLEPLLRDSLRYPALDLFDPTMVWIYGTRETTQAIAAGGAGVPRAAYIFASGQLPYYAAARFDVSRWDFSNFSASFDEGVFA
jgi:hypothetical protein